MMQLGYYLFRHIITAQHQKYKHVSAFQFAQLHNSGKRNKGRWMIIRHCIEMGSRTSVRGYTSVQALQDKRDE